MSAKNQTEKPSLQPGRGKVSSSGSVPLNKPLADECRTCMPLVFDHFRLWGQEAVSFLKKLAAKLPIF